MGRKNHLHPSLQRSLIPRLLSAFPKVSFVIATHSPFIVTASPEAAVYVLRPDSDGRVESVLLDERGQGLDAETTLREVLGVGTTIPIWAEERLSQIVARFESAEPTPDSIGQLRVALAEAGLLSTFPDVVFQTFVDPPA